MRRENPFWRRESGRKSVVNRKGRINTLVRADKLGLAERTFINSGEAQRLISETTGVNLPEQVDELIGFERQTMWSAIHQVDNSNILILGGNFSNEAQFDPKKALASVAILRRPVNDGEEFLAVRVAGYSEDLQRVMEFSYAIDYKERGISPEFRGVKLNHIGFSLSFEEYPEVPPDLVEKTQHIGKTVGFVRYGSYSPGYYTASNEPTDFDESFGPSNQARDGSYNGSVITPAMTHATNHSRMFRARYNSNAKRQIDRVFVGEEGSLAYDAGLYSMVTGYGMVKFGLSLDRRVMQNWMEPNVQEWSANVPVTLRSAGLS